MGDKQKTSEELLEEMYKPKADEVQTEILAAYETLVNNISVDHFKPVQEAIEYETKKQLDLNYTMEVFKSNLYKSISKEFKDRWTEGNLDYSIAQLEFSKEQSKNNEMKWRPTNVPVEDQVRPTLVNSLIKKKMVMEKQLEFQNKKIEDLLLVVEKYRHKLRVHSEKSQQLAAAIESSTEIAQAEENIKRINEFL